MNKHFEDDRRNESVSAMIDMCSAEPDSAVMAREEAAWHLANVDYYSVGAGVEIAEEYIVAAEWFENANIDRLIAEADVWLDRVAERVHAQRIMDDFLDGAEAWLSGEDAPQSFDYMLDEYGCIDDMAVIAARGNVVGGVSVA